jgi:hypothetical protein
MVHTWLRRALTSLGAGVVAVGLLFCYGLWVSPEARLGNRNQRQARLVQPGMSVVRARQVMGPPQKWQLLATGDTMYSYQGHPLSSDGLITMTVSPAGIVKNISH